jgi:hypothetical protein
MNLVQLQREAVDAILAARTQGRRAASCGITLLNKNPRVVAGIRNRYERAARRLGFEAGQIHLQWQDIRDMAKLEALSEEPT